MRTAHRPITALSVVMLLCLGAACDGGEAGPDASDGEGRPTTAPDSPAKATTLGAGEPRAGACLTHSDAETYVANTTVSCTVKHTAEISRVLRLPDGLAPEVRADKARLNTLTDARCPDAFDYSGYQGILSGALYDSWVGPSKQARAKGAKWLACTVATYVPPRTPSGTYRLRARTTPIKGALTSDAALLEAGTVCRPDATRGGTVACSSDAQGRWLALAYRDDPRPFVSSDHQRTYAQSFCSAAAAAYGTPESQEWYAFWSTQANQSFGQNCLIPLNDFRPDAAPVVRGQSQSTFKSPTETRFAAKMQAVGQRLAAEPALMSTQAQEERVANNSNYYSPEVQDRTVCAVLSCTGAYSVAADTTGNRVTFSATVPFESQSCEGAVAFPLSYLGAPHTVGDIACS